MKIKWINDLGAPVLVTAVDLVLESTAPKYSKWATGVMAVGGYVGAYFMKDSNSAEFIKNVGIASLPAFAKNIYDYAKSGGVSNRASNRASFMRSKVSRYPAPAMETPFTSVRLT